MSTIKCDRCSWTKELPFKDIADWHNVKCPSCEDSVIISDEDMAVISGIKAMKKLGLIKLVGEKGFEKAKGLKVTIDTASLTNK